MTRTRTLLTAAMLLAPAVLVAQKPAPKPAAAATKMEKEEESEAQLMKEARVSEAAARVTALKAVPGGVVKDHELEREKGKLIWSYDITVAGKSGIEEVAIDAMTGAMLNKVHETPADEKKEAAEDAAKAKAAAGVKKP
ncbi:MAG: PepSY domain-containing protein [Gemmatimonadota bacterium]